ncbi:MAG: FAD-dependent oxidoreductase [Burkholderiaceae bacterium]
MSEYICKACGHIYNEDAGDPESGLAPGTRFEDIPDDWMCPLCGVTKRDFIPFEPRAIEAFTPVTSGRKALSGASHYDLVIVGAGTAGWEMAEAAREAWAECSIALITGCSGDRYDKPLISVALAKGLTPESMVKESGSLAAQRLGVDLYAHTQVISLSPSQSRIRTTRGSFSYGDVVLAHGARARIPEGLSPRECWRVNHIDHYRAMRNEVASGLKDILIVGAGLIGVEMANDLALVGHRVVLIDAQHRPLAALVRDHSTLEPLMQAWASLPIRFIGGVEVSGSQSGVDQRKSILLSSGEIVEVDLILAAAGLLTPDRLAESAALEWDNGICVNPQTLQTSSKHIYALGDCVSVNGRVSRFIEPIRRQARTIASQVAGNTLVPYEVREVPIRLKATSHPITLSTSG